MHKGDSKYPHTYCIQSKILLVDHLDDEICHLYPQKAKWRVYDQIGCSFKSCLLITLSSCTNLRNVSYPSSVLHCTWCYATYLSISFFIASIRVPFPFLPSASLTALRKLFLIQNKRWVWYSFSKPVSQRTFCELISDHHHFYLPFNWVIC